MELDDKARLYLGASLARVDNVFQLTRRFLSPLERPFYTPSGGWNQVWYGYAPYNPDMVKKYLDIFRVVNNFMHTRQGRRHAGHAARLRQPSAGLCRCALARREDPGAQASPPQGTRGEALSEIAPAPPRGVCQSS